MTVNGAQQGSGEPGPKAPDRGLPSTGAAAAPEVAASLRGAPAGAAAGGGSGQTDVPPTPVATPVAAPFSSLVTVQPAAAGHPTGGDLARAVTSQIAAQIAAEPVAARIELRLDPPELGRVEISLEILDQSLRATVAAERPATHELARRHAELLLGQLQQAGFSGVDLRFAGEQQRGFGWGQPQTGANPGAYGNDGQQADRAEAQAARSAFRGTEGLDLRF